MYKKAGSHGNRRVWYDTNLSPCKTSDGETNAMNIVAVSIYTVPC